MTMQAIVERNITRLKAKLDGEQERAATSKQVIYPEWAHGRILFDADTTRDARMYSSGSDGLYSQVLDNVRDALVETGETRLVPALSYDKQKRRVIVLILQPE